MQLTKVRSFAPHQSVPCSLLHDPLSSAVCLLSTAVVFQITLAQKIVTFDV